VPDVAPRRADVEGALLCRVAAGDVAAFDDLYGRCAAAVHGLVLTVLRDRAQSEEVTQEVFVEAWRTASRFDADRGGGRAWLPAVAARLARGGRPRRRVARLLPLAPAVAVVAGGGLLAARGVAAVLGAT